MKRISLLLFLGSVLLTLLILPGAASDGQSVQVVTVSPDAIPIPAPTIVSAVTDLPGNVTRLEIIPSYSQVNLKPGESKEITVTVRNRDTRTATVRPLVKSQPYSGVYSLESSWITLSPQEAEVPAGGSVKFTVRAAVPSDTLRGSYNSFIVFTDEQYPTPYPSPYPNYVHQMNLGVNVVAPPVIQISTPYIYDQVEAGKVYQYAIEVKNTGTSPVQLNPKSGSEGVMMYGPSGPVEPGMTENAIVVSGPASIQPGGTGTLNVIATVPASASGYYNGYIDLGVDDLSLREGEGRIMVNFNIWKQPPESYVKKFTMERKEPITIDLTAISSMYGGLMSAEILHNMPVREPSFDATLTGPDGVVEITPIKKVLTGSVSLSSDPIVTSPSNAGAYQETNARYSVSYAADGKPGEWQLAVMPKNSQSFEYTITLGGDRETAPADIPVSGQDLSQGNTTLAESP